MYDLRSPNHPLRPGALNHCHFFFPSNCLTPLTCVWQFNWCYLSRQSNFFINWYWKRFMSNWIWLLRDHTTHKRKIWQDTTGGDNLYICRLPRPGYFTIQSHFLVLCRKVDYRQKSLPRVTGGLCTDACKEIVNKINIPSLLKASNSQLFACCVCLPTIQSGSSGLARHWLNEKQVYHLPKTPSSLSVDYWKISR